LKAFLDCLEKIEDQEERDRLAEGQLKDEGKKKRKAPAASQGSPVAVSKVTKVIAPKPKQ